MANRSTTEFRGDDHLDLTVVSESRLSKIFPYEERRPVRIPRGWFQRSICWLEFPGERYQSRRHSRLSTFKERVPPVRLTGALGTEQA